jgi:hypothetical protein
MEAVMAPLRKSRWIFLSQWISTFLVAVIALAWLAASNHCALAALVDLRKASHACCHETDPGGQPPQSTMQCCNTFHVTVPAPAALPAVQLHALRPAWLEASSIPVIVSMPACAEFCATGPPRALGFAETILNRSLLSHAPPCFVA